MNYYLKLYSFIEFDTIIEKSWIAFSYHTADKLFILLIFFCLRTSETIGLGIFDEVIIYIIIHTFLESHPFVFIDLS